MALPRPFHLALAGALAAAVPDGPAAAEPSTASPSEPAAWFVEATREAGIDFVHVNGGTSPIVIYEQILPGAAIFDIDGDGDLDLFLVQSGARRFPLPEGAARPTHKLYRNEGAGPDGMPRFVDRTAAAGVAGHGYGAGAVAADVDNDGDQDLYVTAYGPNQLLVNQGDGTFSDGTDLAGVGDDRMSLSASFGDIDADGLVDLFVPNYVDYLKGPDFCTYNGIKSGCSDKEYPGLPDSLYLNLGVGEDGSPRFRDVARERGVEDPLGRGMGSLFADFDSDGDSDLYVANDGGSNRLFLNGGGGRFKDFTLMSGSGHSEAGLGEASMGTDAADYDNDGDIDLIVTNFARETEALYRNDGSAMFDYATAPAGMAQSSYLPLSWGTQFFDADLDGDLDLYVVNGHVYDVCNLINPQDHFEQPDQLYLNDGTGRLQDVSAQAGPGLAIAASGRGAAFGDLDDDGDVNLYVANDGSRGNLLLNRTPRGSRRWARFAAVGSTSNRDALGARLTVTTGGRRQTREIKSGSSYLSHSDIRPVVGLGEAGRVERLEVRWPGGARQAYEDLPADRDYRFTEVRAVIRSAARTLLILGLLGLPLAAAPLGAAGADAAALLDEGKTLFEAGEVVAALARLRAAVEADPERADAQAWLGKTLLDLKRAAEAEAPLRRAVELAPSEPEFRFLAGMSFYLRADWEPARTLLEAATRLRKGNAADSYYLGRVYLNTSQQALAEGAFRSALNADPHYLPARLHLAITLRDRGNLADAEVEFKRVLERDAAQPLPHYYLGSLQLDRGDYEAARSSLETSIRLDPEFEASHFRLGLTLMNLKQFEAAAAEFQRAIDLNPYYDLAWQGLGRAYARLDRTEEAEKALARFQLLEPVGQRIIFLRQVLANSPASSRARLDLAAELTKIDELGPARDLLQQALQIDPEFAEAHARLGRVLALQGDTEAAAVRYYEAVRRDPGNVDYRYEFGVTLARAGYCRQAIMQFLEVVARNAEHAAAYGDLGTCYAKLGDLPRAEESLKRAAEIDPIPSGPYANLGSLYAGSGRLDEAVAQYRLALQRAPEDADIRFNLGGALLEQGAFVEARTELERATALRPEDRDMRRALARAQVRSGQGEEAVGLLGEMLRSEPNDAVLISDLGAALGALGRLDAAERAHRSAIALDPRGPSHRLLFAETLVRAGRGAEALAQVEEALRLAPGEPEILYRLAAARADQGDAAGATEALDQAVSAGFRDGRRLVGDPAFVALRGDPRFEGVVARVAP